MKAILLAAGASTRTRPLTYSRPKPLLPVLDSTILHHNLDQLVGLVDEVILAEHYLADQIQGAVSTEYKGMKIQHVVIPGMPGTGGTVSALRGKVSGSFLVLNGDDLYAHDDLAELVKYERAALISRDAALMRTLDGWQVEDDHIVSLHHRGDPEPEIWGIATGAYVLGEEYFELPPKKISIRDEIGLPHTLEGGLANTPYRAVTVKNYWLPVGYAWDLLAANDLAFRFMQPQNEGTIEDGVAIDGVVSLGKGSVIRRGTIIEGNVFIGENTVVGPSAYIRENVVIGNESIVGFGAEVKHSVLMNNVHMHHHGYIADSVIGSYSNIGAGTTVGNLRHDNRNWSTIVRGERVDTGMRKLGAFMGDFTKLGTQTSLIGGALLGPASWTLPGAVIQSVVPPFTMGENEIPLKKFEALPYFAKVKALKEHLTREEKS